MSSPNNLARLSLMRRVGLTIIVVGAAAAAVLFVQQAKGLPFQSPYPPAKATIIARSNHNDPGAPRASKTAISMSPDIPGAATPNPNATPRTGIYVTHQGPFANSNFSPSNQYIGPVNGTYDVVFAGTAWTNYETRQGQGALRVYEISGKYLGTYTAPDGSQWVQVNSAQGSVLTLSSNKSAALKFDLATDTFIS